MSTQLSSRLPPLSAVVVAVASSAHSTWHSSAAAARSLGLAAAVAAWSPARRHASSTGSSVTRCGTGHRSIRAVSVLSAPMLRCSLVDVALTRAHSTVAASAVAAATVASAAVTAPGGWLLLADMHFDKSRLERLEATCGWILSEVRRLRPAHIFLCGDTLHTRNDVHVEASSAVASFLRDLLHAEYGDQAAPHVHLLIGNHDMHHASSRRVTSLDSFAVHQRSDAAIDSSATHSTAASPSPAIPVLPESSLSRLHLYRELTFLQLDGQKVLMVPYHHGEDCRLVEEYIERLAQTHDLNDVVCLAHLPLSGATISGIAVQAASGYKYSHASVSLMLLSKFKRVFLGHFHIHQEVGNSGRVLYIGAPQQFNYGDANDDRKGFVSYDPRTNAQWQLYKNPHAQHYFSRTIDALEKELAAAEPAPAAVSDTADTSSAATPASPSLPSSVFSGKCVEIVLPAELDSIAQERRIEAVKKRLKEQYGIEDLKIKQQKASDKRKEGDDAALIDAADAGALTAESLANELVGDIVNGDLRPLVEKYVEQDKDVKPEQKAAYAAVMRSMLDAVDAELVSSAASPAAGESKHFRAQLQRIDITNFLSIQGSASFDFSALHSGVYFISGQNGAGKSLLLEALTWCLFGSTLRGHEADKVGRNHNGLPADEIVNDVIKKRQAGAQVRVEVQFANGYSFTRTHVHGVAGSVLRIVTPQGPMQPKSTKRLDEEALVSMLGIGFERFVSSVLLSSTTKNFISAKAEEKRRIIEELLGFTHFEKLQVYAKDQRTAKKTEKEQLDQQLAFHADKLATFKQTEVEQLEKQKRRAEEIARLAAQLKTLNDSHSSLQTKLSEMEEKERRAVSKREAESKQLQVLQQQLDELRNQETQQTAQDLRKLKSEKDVALSTLIKQLLHQHRTTQRTHEERIRTAHLEQLQKATHASQQLNAKIASLSQIEQLRSQLQLVKHQIKAQVEAIARAASPQMKTINCVVGVLQDIARLDATPSLAPSIRARLREDAIDPLQQIVQENAGSADNLSREKQLQQYELHSAELQNELEMASEGIDVSNELAQLPALRKQQLELSAQASKPTSVGEQQRILEGDAEWTRCHVAIQQLENPSQSTEASVIALLKEIAAFTTQLVELDAAAQQQRSREAVLQSQRKSLELSVASLANEETQSRSQAKRLAGDVQSLELQRARKDKEVELAQESKSATEVELQRVRGEVAVASSAMQQSTALLDASQVQLSALTHWLDRVSDAPSKQVGSFRSFCIERVLGILNPLLESNLQFFSQNDTGAITHPLSCTLTSELSLVASAGAMSMDKRSEGQRKRTHLALFLALFSLSQRRSTFHNLFLFLDEAFDSLDEDGQKAVSRWIKEYAASSSQPRLAATNSASPLVFVITHSPYTNPAVSNGCLHVRLDALTRASTYRLETATLDISAKPFVVQTIDAVQEEATALIAPKPKRKSTPRVKKPKVVAAVTEAIVETAIDVPTTKQSAATAQVVEAELDDGEEVDSSFLSDMAPLRTTLKRTVV